MIIMVRKKKIKALISSCKNTAITLGDPKFQCECYVLLENCDFSKYPIVSKDKRRTEELISRSESKATGTLGDPKFQCKCYVPLKNFDFSKYSIISKEKGNLSKRMSGNKKPLSSKKSKLPVDDLSKDLDQASNINIEFVAVQNQRNNPEVSKMKSTNTNRVMQHMNKALPVKSTDLFKKSDSETSDFMEKKELRTRKKVDYKEKRSIGTPDVSKVIISTENNRIPVYKQLVVELPKSRKRKGDLYDFIAESDDDKDSDVSFKIDLPCKKKKIHHQVHFHQKINHKKLNAVKTNKNVGTLKYNDKINGIMTKFSKKLDSKNGSKKPLQTNTSSNKKEERKYQIDNNNQRVSDAVFNSTMLPESQNIIFSDESSIVNRCKDNISKVKIIGNGKINKSKNMYIPSSENSSLNTGGDSHSDISSFNSCESLNLRSSEGNIENLFGFSEEKEREEGATNRIHIIQDVVIDGFSLSKQNISTPKRFEESWRFDSSVARNPHFIAVKKNSLPSLNQEPILDHTFDERINVQNTIKSVPSNKKSPKQQSILNYIEAAKEYPENCNYSQSLYDIDELSPIKDKKANQENSFERKKLMNESQRVKRNILGVIDTNISPPMNKEARLITDLSSDIDKTNRTSKEPENYGFDTTSDVIEQEHVREENSKPFRIEFTYQKSNRPKQSQDKMTKPVRDSEVRKLIEEDPGFDEVVNQDGLDCGSLGLFEDLEETLKPTKSNNRLHPKKKMDKAPQEKLSNAAKKWIKQFNEMCDEVDHEQLEIEEC